MRPLDSLRGALDRNAAPAVVLATALASALLAAVFVARVVEAQERMRFRELVDTSVDALRRRMDAHVAKLRSARGFVQTFEGDPPRDAFRGFVASFELARYYPGIQGIGWARALRPDDVARHEAAVRASGLADYRVWPEGARELRSSIVMLEPLDWRNRRAIGFDMFSEPTRRAAMERARDTGEVAASGKVELVQEAGAQRQAGFLMYLAVYERPPATLEERRQLLRGWVYAPFRAADLLHGALAPDPAGALGLSAYDGAELEPQALLHDGLTTRPGATALRTLEVGGRTWTLRFAATRAFSSRTERALPAVVLAAGVAVGLLLFSIVRADARARRRAERAAARASFLAEVGKALSASTEAERALPGVATLAAERVADGCLVHLLDPSGLPGWIVGHPDAARAARAAERLSAARLEEGDALGALASLRSGEAQLRRLDPARNEASRSVAAIVRELGAVRALALPLLARGEPLGVVVLLARDARPFEPDDVRLGEDFARLVSAAVDTARLYRQAREAVAARDEFLSIASHELKTPLTSLVLHADSLRATAARGHLEQAVRKAEVIRRNVDRLSRLVASLLDISRIGAGRLDLELEEVDLGEVVREVAARFEDEARRAGCALQLLVGGPVVGRWDRLRVDQVVTNLLSNAIKYGPGKPVELRVEPAGERALLSVRDHGIGISEADQRRIFQRFERAVSKRHYGGFGLGLWIVRQIVEALGGTVRVESLPGEGSTFTVELHREVRDAAGRRADPPGAPPQA